jgi:hypothetical protein
LYINASPVWTTSAGSLGTFAEQVAMSVSATATDESAITYSLANGSSLPTGVTLNSSTGLISGTLPDVASNTTYTFTINASDGVNTVVPRTFSFISNVSPVWVTSAGSLGSFDEQTSITLSALSATDISDTVTYALANGSTLPSGITLNSASGVISGTLPDIASETTYTFTINASDGFTTLPRTFSITSQIPRPATFDALIVAGGGEGGSGYYGGGGGAGGVRQLSAISLTSAQAAISVGLGGTGSTFGNSGNNGGNSSIAILNGTTYTATGGGGGAGTEGHNAAGDQASAGGSGGGGSLYTNFNSGASGNAGSYSPVEGYAGGSGAGYPSTTTANGGAGGGGGAGGAGESVPGASGRAGAGGIGITSTITGSSVNYGGGGGGGVWTGSQESGAGAAYGGGRGAADANAAGTNGTANTGGGGGGTSFIGSGGDGGSGVVIIAYPDTYRAITTIPETLTYTQPTRSGYRVYRFTSGSGTVTF